MAETSVLCSVSGSYLFADFKLKKLRFLKSLEKYMHTKNMYSMFFVCLDRLSRYA
jgi:hypothetical protein